MSNAMILRPQSFDQLMKFAEIAARTEMVPKAFQNKPGDIMLAVQMGSEIGISPMQALQNIAVVNGRPAVWGDAMLALCKSHPNWMGIKEEVTGEGDAMVATCEVHRKGDHPVIATFSVDDAKKAKLWQTEARIKRKGRDGGTYEADNDSPWFRYPKRMLQMRARGFALRDAFPDALKGLISAEEAQDIPTDSFTGTTINSTAVPVEPVDTSPPPKETPEAAARRITDELLAKIAGCGDENALHDLRGAMRTQAVIDRLTEKFPALADEVTTAFATAFNGFVLPEAAQ